MRLNVIVTGQIPNLWSSFGTFEGMVTLNNYFPTFLEVMGSIGALSLIFFLQILGYLFLPLVSSKDAEIGNYKFWENSVNAEKLTNEED